MTSLHQKILNNLIINSLELPAAAAASSSTAAAAAAASSPAPAAPAAAIAPAIQLWTRLHELINSPAVSASDATSELTPLVPAALHQLPVLQAALEQLGWRETEFASPLTQDALLSLEAAVARACSMSGDQ